MKNNEKLSFIGEMAGKRIVVPFADGIDINELTEGDKKPMFVTIEALCEGESRNGRYYDRDTILEVERQVNELRPDAYDGHLKEEERTWKRPEPRTIWVGAKSYEIEGKTRLFIKGYVLPSAKDLKSYLRAAKAASKHIAVSIYGQARLVFDKVKNSRLVKDIQLESIDWARPGGEGVKTLGYLAITSEMAGNETILEMFDEYKDELEGQIRESILISNDNVKTICEMLDVKEGDLIETVTEMKKAVDEKETELTDIYIDGELKNRLSLGVARMAIKPLIVAELTNGAYNRSRAREVITETFEKKEVKELIGKLSSGRELFALSDNQSVEKRSYTKIR